MKGYKLLDSRRLSVAAFSFSSVYLLSFLFEGQVLYSLLQLYGVRTDPYIRVAMIAHFLGLFTCGLFVRSQRAAKHAMLGGLGACVVSALLFFSPIPLYG